MTGMCQEGVDRVSLEVFPYKFAVSVLCLLTSSVSWPELPKNAASEAVCIYSLKLQYMSVCFGVWWWRRGEKGADLKCVRL